MDNIIFLAVTTCVVSLILIFVTFSIIKKNQTNKYKKEIEYLDIEKNKIESAPIVPELAKIESYLKNEKLEVMYNEWKERRAANEYTHSV